LTSVKLIQAHQPLPWPTLATTHVIVVLAIHPNRLLAAIKQVYKRKEQVFVSSNFLSSPSNFHITHSTTKLSQNTLNMSDYDNNNNGDYNEGAARFAGDTVGSAGKSSTPCLPNSSLTSTQRAASTAQTKTSTTKNNPSATPSAATHKM
jgi:hypothetical protein